MARDIKAAGPELADVVDRVFAMGALAVRDQVGLDQLVCVSLLTEGGLRGLYQVSPRGVVAWLRAHADFAEATAADDAAGRGQAIDRLKEALQVLYQDRAHLVEAQGRRVS